MAIALDQAWMSQLPELRWCSMRRRVRAKIGDATVVDSRDSRQVWEPHRVVGSYAVPVTDIVPAPDHPTTVTALAEHPRIMTPDHRFEMHTIGGVQWRIPFPGRPLEAVAFTPDDPDLDGYVVLDWAAFDEWWEEEQVVVGHPHDPFARIDTLTTTRHVVIRAGDTVLAESRRPTLLLETQLPPRHYLPREDVRMDRLVPSETRTTCAYKGEAEYWSVAADGREIADVAWTYRDPLHDGLPIRDLICFYDHLVEVVVDGTPGR
ncbi:DUF427 domain-containing protein [Gordonia sp. NPDC003424]